MKYMDLVHYYEKLENTAKKLEKKYILSELYRKCGNNELSEVVMLSMGKVYSAGQKELGLAREMIRRIIGKTYGIEEKEVFKKFKETGDLGSTAEFFSGKRIQSSLMKKELNVNHVFENLRKLPDITGKGSQERKMSLVSELLSQANPVEARYIVRTVLGDMRIGVATGIVRNAIADAFGKESKDVEMLFDVTGHYGKVAERAKKGDMKASIEIFSPVRVMLAERGSELDDALSKFENPAIEIKYDGFRIQIHKKGREVKIFSRRMEDITRQFPDIVSWSKDLKAKDSVVEGEVIAVDKNNNPKPFQILSRRIQRKYHIEKTAKEIPVQVNLFDLIYLDSNWMKKPLKERWEKLSEIVTNTKNFKLAGHIETKDFVKAENFYKKSLANMQEGVIVKNLDAPYQPGRRVGYWIKVKPVMEPLDLCIVGAEWGEGKRTKWLGSFILAAYDKKNEKFLETGRMASGLIEKSGDSGLPTMEDLTKKLKKFITGEDGKTVKLKPEIVVEVAYEELQKSPKYPTGYAMRFPRILRIRDDKKPEDANTVKDIEKLYSQQKGRK